MEHRLNEYRSDEEIMDYCRGRGPRCVLAFDAVSLLQKKGLKAWRLQNGYPEWKMAGFLLEVSTSET